jgi:antitoxin HicB
MPHYIALIHTDDDRCYGVSFPDVAGVITAGDTIDEAMQKAGEVLEFPAEDWSDHTGGAFPKARAVDELRSDLEFQEAASDAIIATVPFRAKAEAAK